MPPSRDEQMFQALLGGFFGFYPAWELDRVIADRERDGGSDTPLLELLEQRGLLDAHRRELLERSADEILQAQGGDDGTLMQAMEDFLAQRQGTIAEPAPEPPTHAPEPPQGSTFMFDLPEAPASVSSGSTMSLSDLDAPPARPSPGLATHGTSVLEDAPTEEARRWSDHDDVTSWTDHHESPSSTFQLDLPGDVSAKPPRPPTATRAARSVSHSQSRTIAQEEERVTLEHPGRYTFLDWSAFRNTQRRVPAGAKQKATIGAGGMGRVLLAFDEHVGREIALKEIQQRLASGTSGSGTSGAHTFLSRFLQEARVTGTLEHPSIIPVYEVGLSADGRHHYYTMRLVRGRSLDDALEETRSLRERLALLPHVVALCHAIAYAHSRGVVHRDIKPENVMIGEFGETVVLDWGIAKLIGESDDPGDMDPRFLRGVASSSASKATVGGALGTPAFMAPERLTDPGATVGGQTDIWSLGVVLYQLLTGSLPVPGDNLIAILDWLKDTDEHVEPVERRTPDAPRELASIAMRCLARDKRQRYDDAREVARDIERYQAGERVVAHRYTTWEIVHHAVTRSPALSTALGVGALAVVVAGVLVWNNRAARAEADRLRRQAAFETILLANAALAEDRPLEAKARLRSAIEAEDTMLARTLWHRLHSEPLIWSTELHTEPTGLAFSPDNSQLAVAKGSPDLLLVDTLTRTEATLRGGEENLYVVDWSSSGAMLAAGAGNGDVLLWTLPEPTPRVLQLHQDLVSSVQLNQDGTRLLTGSFDGVAHVSDLASGETLHTFEGHEGLVTTATWSPDERTIATTGLDGTLKVWDAAIGSLLRTCEGHEGESNGAAFSPDGDSLYSSGLDGTLRRYDASSGRELSVHDGRPAAYTALALSAQRGVLAAGTLDGSIHLTPAGDDGSPRVLPGHNDLVLKLEVSSTGDWLASGSDDRLLRLWDLGSGEGLGDPVGHQGVVTSVAWSDDGSRMVTGGWDGVARIWDARAGTQLGVLRGHEGKVYHAAFAPGDELIATVGTDETVRTWDASTGELLRIHSGHEDEVLDLAFHPDGATMATAGMDGTVRLWDLETGSDRVVLEGWGSTRVAYSADGRRLAMARSDWEGAELLLLDIRRGQIVQRSLLDGDFVAGIAFAADGGTLWAITRGGGVLAWNPTTAEHELVMQIDGAGKALAVSPSGDLLAACSTAHEAFVHDLEADTTSTLEGHGGPISAVAFHPDGSTLATAGYDATVRTWYPHSAQPHWRGTALLVSMGLRLSHSGWEPLEGVSSRDLTSLAWSKAAAGAGRKASVSADGRWLCLADPDGSVELWDALEDRRLMAEQRVGVQRLVATAGGCLTLQATGELALLGTAQADLGAIQGAVALEPDGPEGWLALMPGGIVGASRVDEPPTLLNIPQQYPTAITRTEQGFAVGEANGRIQLLVEHDNALDPRGFLQDTPPSPTTAMATGPGSTLAVGFEDGTVGLWNPETGRRLLQLRLHGPVASLAVHGTRLHALSLLGDYRSMDLGAMGRDYCELMAEVWEQLPVCWDGSQAVFCAPPQTHSCRPGRGPGS